MDSETHTLWYLKKPLLLTLTSYALNRSSAAAE